MYMWNAPWISNFVSRPTYLTWKEDLKLLEADLHSRTPLICSWRMLLMLQKPSYIPRNVVSCVQLLLSEQRAKTDWSSQSHNEEDLRFWEFNLTKRTCRYQEPNVFLVCLKERYRYVDPPWYKYQLDRGGILSKVLISHKQFQLGLISQFIEGQLFHLLNLYFSFGINADLLVPSLRLQFMFNFLHFDWFFDSTKCMTSRPNPWMASHVYLSSMFLEILPFLSFFERLLQSNEIFICNCWVCVFLPVIQGLSKNFVLIES